MSKCKGLRLLGDLVISRTYSRIKEDGTPENWHEITERYLDMMREKFPELKTEITGFGSCIHQKKIVPSMRGLQFAGKPVFDNNSRMFNCSALQISEPQDFGDFAFLLMSGSGVGDFVLPDGIEKLPPVPQLTGKNQYNFVVPDTREGWADSYVALIKNPEVNFVYSGLRPTGAKLSSGGKASGPGPLMVAHTRIREILFDAAGRKLTPREVFDINGHIASSILAGGVRRAARISGFSPDDYEMLEAKNEPGWMKFQPQRFTANVSQYLLRDSVTEEQFMAAMDKCLDSASGEPGILWGDGRHLANPCGEISLLSRGLCNLTEIILPHIKDEAELYETAKAASFFGTLQAGFTDFKYIHPEWKKNAEEEALLGVSMTGIAQCDFSRPTVEFVAQLARTTNEHFARRIGINLAKRITTVKPSGSTSASMGCSSGVHAEWPYVLRKVNVDHKSELGKYLFESYGLNYALNEKHNFLEQSVVNPQCYIINIPLHYEGVIDKDEETAIEFLNRVKALHEDWIRPGHREGAESHNVSSTCTFLSHEKEDIKKWMWENRESYRGISFLPKEDHNYPELPFNKITREEYEEMIVNLPEFDIFSVQLEQKQVEDSAACVGGQCEIKSL